LRRRPLNHSGKRITPFVAAPHIISGKIYAMILERRTSRKKKDKFHLRTDVQGLSIVVPSPNGREVNG
jgi:hypothetical protein